MQIRIYIKWSCAFTKQDINLKVSTKQNNTASGGGKAYSQAITLFNGLMQTYRGTCKQQQCDNLKQPISYQLSLIYVLAVAESWYLIAYYGLLSTIAAYTV